MVIRSSAKVEVHTVERPAEQLLPASNGPQSLLPGTESILSMIVLNKDVNDARSESIFCLQADRPALRPLDPKARGCSIAMPLLPEGRLAAENSRCPTWSAHCWRRAFSLQSFEGNGLCSPKTRRSRKGVDLDSACSARSASCLLCPRPPGRSDQRR